MIQCGKPGKCRESCGVALINEICHGEKRGGCRKSKDFAAAFGLECIIEY